MARFLRRQVTYRLRPPVVLGTAAPFIAEPVRAQSAPPVRTRTRSQLRPPFAVASAYTPFGPDTTRAPQPRQGRQPHYLLRPPATLVQPAAPFIARRPASTFATQARQGRRASYVLRPPATLVQPTTPFIARREPTSFATSTRRATEQHFFTSTLFPPEIIDPLPAAPGLTRKLAPSPRQGRLTHSRLRPPATLVQPVPPFRPLQTVYATATRRAVEHHGFASRLRPPTVVSIPSGDNPSGGVFDPNFFLLIHP